MAVELEQVAFVDHCPDVVRILVELLGQTDFRSAGWLAEQLGLPKQRVASLCSRMVWLQLLERAPGLASHAALFQLAPRGFLLLNHHPEARRLQSALLTSAEDVEWLLLDVWCASGPLNPRAMRRLFLEGRVAGVQKVISPAGISIHIFPRGAQRLPVGRVEPEVNPDYVSVLEFARGDWEDDVLQYDLRWHPFPQVIRDLQGRVHLVRRDVQLLDAAWVPQDLSGVTLRELDELPERLFMLMDLLLSGVPFREVATELGLPLVGVFYWWRQAERLIFKRRELRGA